jgi:hypothetical protein
VSELGVICECGRSLPVKESDAGSTLHCSCTRLVVVPLIEEFSSRPVLNSAPTVELRIRRMLKLGELPNTTFCVRCGGSNGIRVWTLDLWCEESSVHASGGPRLLIIPGLIAVSYYEERRVEIHGRDNVVPVPICVCSACKEQADQWDETVVRIPPSWLVGVSVALVSMILVAVIFADPTLVWVWIFSGLILGVSAGVLMSFRRPVVKTDRKRQEACKEMLRRVPAYRQLLQKYPFATVVPAGY